METLRPMKEGLPFRMGTAGRALHTYDQSGDQYLYKEFDDGVLAAVVDGLGHGEKAAEAACTAIRALAEAPHEPVTDLIERCHGAMRSTRGGVISLASFRRPATSNGHPWEMTWIGIGNVRGVLFKGKTPNGSGREWLIPRAGIIGYQMPKLYPATLPVTPGMTLVFVTDGILSNFAEGLTIPPLTASASSAQQLADSILANAQRSSDDALVLVVQCEG